MPLYGNYHIKVSFALILRATFLKSLNELTSVSSESFDTVLKFDVCACYCV